MAIETAENSSASDEQVAAAFQSLFGTSQGRDEEPVQDAVETATTTTESTEQVTDAETPTTQVSTESPGQPDSTPAEQVVEESEDVKALRANLAAMTAERDSVAERASKNLEWARGLGLRKASEADRLRGILKQIADGKEIERAEVERVLGQQAQTAQEPVAQNSTFQFRQEAPPVAQVDENTQLEAEQFVLDYRINDEAAGKFKAWMESADSGLTNKDVVPGSLYHTLALAYSKYEKASRTPNPATVQAVKSLQKTQREVARATGAVTNRAKPSAPAEPEVDLMKLAATDVEGFRKRVNVSDLMQMVARGE